MESKPDTHARKSQPGVNERPAAGWAIQHPDGKLELQYFNAVDFKTKLDGYKDSVTPERWCEIYRPNCKIFRAIVIAAESAAPGESLEAKIRAIIADEPCDNDGRGCPTIGRLEELISRKTEGAKPTDTQPLYNYDERP